MTGIYSSTGTALADRPLTGTAALIGAGFVVSLLIGVVAGFLSGQFRLVFGWTVASGMILTAVAIMVVHGINIARR